MDSYKNCEYLKSSSLPFFKFFPHNEHKPTYNLLIPQDYGTVLDKQEDFILLSTIILM
jgi:hypothetical protein